MPASINPSTHSLIDQHKDTFTRFITHLTQNGPASHEDSNQLLCFILTKPGSAPETHDVSSVVAYTGSSLRLPGILMELILGAFPNLPDTHVKMATEALQELIYMLWMVNGMSEVTSKPGSPRNDN